MENYPLLRHVKPVNGLSWYLCSEVIYYFVHEELSDGTNMVDSLLCDFSGTDVPSREVTG